MSTIRQTLIYSSVYFTDFFCRSCYSSAVDGMVPCKMVTARQSRSLINVEPRLEIDGESVSLDNIANVQIGRQSRQMDLESSMSEEAEVAEPSKTAIIVRQTLRFTSDEANPGCLPIDLLKENGIEQC